METTRLVETASSGFIAALVICLSYFAYRLFARRNSIPGPMLSLPIFGHILFLGKEPHKELRRLTKKYGPVFSFKLGLYSVVTIGDYKTLKDAMDNPSFLGRPPYTAFNLLPDGLGMVSDSGLPWHGVRKYSITSLKRLTSKVNSLDKIIQEDLMKLTEVLEETKGQPKQILNHLTVSSISNMWYFLFGERLDSQSSKLFQLEAMVNTVADYMGMASPCGFLPWLAKLFSMLKIGGYDKALSILNEANSMFMKEIEQKKKKAETLENEMFVTGYLSLMNKENNGTIFTLSRLRGTLQAFVVGGTETTRSLIEWTLYTLVKYPQVHRNVQKEIDDVVGKERPITWADRIALPYTMATITEVLRWKTVAPITTPRCALEDTTLAGYHIPKGTVLMINLWAIHNDTDYWENPEEFRPERFLSEDGKKYVKRESYVPFNIGRRMCPGNEMALTVTFLYVSTLVQKFDIRAPEGVKIDVDSYVLGLISQPLHQKLCFYRRD